MKNETFTPERIKAEADAFFEWDGEDRSLVTTTSCLLFAQHIAGLMQARAAQPAPVVPDGVRELLTEMVDIHRRRGVVLTIHIEQLAEILAAAPAQGQQGEFGDAYQGAREDLAIWKRRALEAEEKVRQQDSIIDHLTLEAQGETRMGEPFIAQGQQSPNYWRDLAIANRKVADEALAELSALKAQQAEQKPVRFVEDREVLARLLEDDDQCIGDYHAFQGATGISLGSDHGIWCAAYAAGMVRQAKAAPQPAPAQDVAVPQPDAGGLVEALLAAADALERAEFFEQANKARAAAQDGEKA